MNQTDQRLETKVSERVYISRNREETSPAFYEQIKRAIDIILSLAGIIILFPLLLFIGLIIKAEDPKGGIIFKQTRVGKNGKSFGMYKLRSMVNNAEEMLPDLLNKNEISGAMFKMKEDPRVTKVGKIIRKTSIDELPQLWNVLKGEMSLVGPRPPLPHEVVQYTTYDMQRLKVTPGCTGLWQVSGRNRLGFHEMVELDLIYIQRKGIWTDFKILFKTVLVLLGSNNAF